LIDKAIQRLSDYISRDKYEGYDPYDTLNSIVPLKKLGKGVAAAAIQFQKLNPVNIRPLLGIKKGYNAKGMGLLLKAYCILHREIPDDYPLNLAEELFLWLRDNGSPGYKYPCWGYNFDWATPSSYLDAYTPSVVVTSFVIDGIWEYYMLTGCADAKRLILGAADWVINEIPVTEFSNGVSFAYTAQSKGACYNASLLSTEILARADKLNDTAIYSAQINQAIDFVLNQQKPFGEWWYSFNPENGQERKQIDFHQGFVLMSLSKLNELLPQAREDIDEAISRGLDYYRKHQFYDSGRSLWRIPKKWPVDIHNQSQGIITFSELSGVNKEYLAFAEKIADWTIHYMQDPKGYFYYRKFSWYTNKIPYMRWSQAWMLLALATLLGRKRLDSRQS